MNDKSYFYHDEESGSYEIGGEPVEQEEKIGEAQENTANGEYDPDKHPDNYIMRM